MWAKCLIASVALWLLFIIFAVITGVKEYTGKRRILSPVNMMLTGTFISGFVIFLPIYIQKYSEALLWSEYFSAAAQSLNNAFRLFFVCANFDEIFKSIPNKGEQLYSLYCMFAALLYLFAPMLTFEFILSFFKNVSAYRRYLRAFFRDVYVFSELNEKSVTLAQSIASHRKAAIVFVDVSEKNEKSSDALEKAKKLGAICFKNDILSVNLKLHSRKKPIRFFVMSDDEKKNSVYSFGIINAYKTVDDVMLYYFSKTVDSELVMASMDKGKVKVRRVNDVRALVYRNLYDKGDLLFKSAVETAGGEKKICAVVVGMGAHGEEMMKALTWFCQMDGYEIQIHAFDKDPLARSRFAASCPELMSEKYNGVNIAGESRCLITVNGGVDAATKEFVDEIKKIGDVTYAFVSLGSDEENIKCSVKLRTLFEQMHVSPLIQAVLYDSDKKQALKNLTNYCGQSYNIDFIGDMKELYSEDVIINSELEREALQRHLRWGDEEEFWRYEYNYRSSMASALRLKARLDCGIPSASKKECDLTQKERHDLEVLEHRCWNAYMRSEGYVYSGSTDASSRNDLGKMHNDLVPFDELTEGEKRKDSKTGSR